MDAGGYAPDTALFERGRSLLLSKLSQSFCEIPNTNLLGSKDGIEQVLLFDPNSHPSKHMMQIDPTNAGDSTPEDGYLKSI